MARLPTSLPETDKPVTKKSNDVEEKSGSLNCTICLQQFENLKDCLRHELLKHNDKKANGIQKSLRNKVNAIINNLKTDDQQTLHTSLSNALKICEQGEELASIFKFHRMNDENLCMVYERINNSLRKDLHTLKTINIYPFGSFVTGLALRDSDIDLYINHPDVNQNGQSTYWQHLSPSQRKIYNTINDALHRSKNFTDVIAIRQARVPIIKCKHTSTGFSMDINLSCPSSVHNTNFIRDLLKLDKRLHELMVFLKVWAKQLQLIGRGNMNSYCLITLVIFYLQQSLPDRPTILPSIEKLQKDIPPQYVLGVNYAYKFPNNIPALSHKLTTSSLIKGFFEFYCSFEFENFLIAPCIGRAIPIEKFKTNKYKYSTYYNQLQFISKMFNKPEDPFQIGRCFHLQDPFALNHNIGKAIAAPNLDYFRNCLQQACSIYNDTNISTDAQRYEALLYGIVERIAQEARVASGDQSITDSHNGTVSGTNPQHELSLRLTPSRAEQRAIVNSIDISQSTQNNINQLWVEHYLEIIPEVITDIYCLDLQSATPTHSDKQQRLENNDRTITWQVSGSVDQWTGRLHQRYNNKTFMQIQLEQTEKFTKERRQNSAFAVQLNGVITLNILNDCSAIEIIIAPRNKKCNLTKKDPLHKFFNMFKCSMQTFNLKERLDMRASKKI